MGTVEIPNNTIELGGRSSDSILQKRLKVAAAVLIWSVAVNLPYWLAGHIFRFEWLGWFGLEYVIVGVVALYALPVVSLALFLVAMSTDLLFGICDSYYLTVGPCISNLLALGSFSAARLVKACAIAFLIVGAGWGASWFQRNSIEPKDRKLVTVLLLGFAMFVQGLDLFKHPLETGIVPNFLYSNAREATSDSDVPLLVRNPVLRLARLEWAFDIKVALMGRRQEANAKFAPSASEIGLRESPGANAYTSTQSPDIVLVLVESWGLSTSEKLNSAFESPYRLAGISDRYRVQKGRVPFFGSTVAAESRELCGNSSAFHLLDATTDELSRCLVARLDGAGYRTVALHGMDGHMFSRSTWYKRMGFQEVLFSDSFAKMGMPSCDGAFRGTCDADLADWIGKRLRVPSNNPQLVYWVTLNSHLPVVVPSGLKDGAACPAELSFGSKETSFGPGTILCSWYQLELNVHQSLAKLAMGDLARPTIFIIVGDHAPPFANYERRHLFSQTEVPYLIFWPQSRDPHVPEHSKGMKVGN